MLFYCAPFVRLEVTEDTHVSLCPCEGISILLAVRLLPLRFALDDFRARKAHRYVYIGIRSSASAPAQLPGTFVSRAIFTARVDGAQRDDGNDLDIRSFLPFVRSFVCSLVRWFVRLFVLKVEFSRGILDRQRQSRRVSRWH